MSKIKRRITKVYSCKKCNIVCKSKKEYDMHIKTHPVKCQKCGIETPNINEMRTHWENERTEKCNFCKYETMDANLMQQHVNSTHCQTCEHCLFTCTNREELLNHVKNVHAKCCQNCEFASLSQKALDEHIRDEHMYKCSICNLILDLLIPYHSSLVDNIVLRLC